MFLESQLHDHLIKIVKLKEYMPFDQIKIAESKSKYA